MTVIITMVHIGVVKSQGMLQVATPIRHASQTVARRSTLRSHHLSRGENASWGEGVVHLQRVAVATGGGNARTMGGERRERAGEVTPMAAANDTGPIDIVWTLADFGRSASKTAVAAGGS